MSLVVNFDLPQKLFTYFHRIGRTGRFGAEGLAVTLVQGDEKNYLAETGEISIVRLESAEELGKVSEEIMRQREAKAQEEGKLVEYGLAATRRKAQIRWKESERHTGESVISDWKDVADAPAQAVPANSEYKYFPAELREDEECGCERCTAMSEAERESFHEFRKKLAALYDCPTCAKTLEAVVRAAEDGKM